MWRREIKKCASIFHRGAYQVKQRTHNGDLYVVVADMCTHSSDFLVNLFGHAILQNAVYLIVEKTYSRDPNSYMVVP